MTAPEKASRSYGIDAMRALAISFVVIFHYTVTGAAEGAWRFTAGWVGVQIFFLISGYCIAETIRRSASVADFLALRMSRLYPTFAVVVVALAILKPANGLELTANLLFAWDLGAPMLDGVFWSLLVEVKFYIFFAFLTYLCGDRTSRAFAWMAIGLSGCWCALTLAQDSIQLPSAALYFKAVLSRVVVAPMLPFFAIGILASARSHSRGKPPRLLEASTLTMSIVALVVLSSQLSSPYESMLASVVTYGLGLALFLAAVRGVRFPFSWIVNKIGVLSYVIYLVHNELAAMLSLRLKDATGVEAEWWMMIVIVLVSTWAISLLCEWRFRRFFTHVILAVLSAIGLRRLRYAAA